MTKSFDNTFIQIIHPVCCGLDIHKDKISACLITLDDNGKEQYELLKDAVYERRGWTQNGIPTVETVKRLGIDFSEVLDVLKQNGVH